MPEQYFVKMEKSIDLFRSLINTWFRQCHVRFNSPVRSIENFYRWKDGTSVLVHTTSHQNLISIFTFIGADRYWSCKHPALLHRRDRSPCSFGHLETLTKAISNFTSIFWTVASTNNRGSCVEHVPYGSFRKDWIDWNLITRLGRIQSNFFEVTICGPRYRGRLITPVK